MSATKPPSCGSVYQWRRGRQVYTTYCTRPAGHAGQHSSHASVKLWKRDRVIRPEAVRRAPAAGSAGDPVRGEDER